MNETEIKEVNDKIRNHGHGLTLIVCGRGSNDFSNLPKFKCIACKTKFDGPSAREDFQVHRKTCAKQ